MLVINSYQTDNNLNKIYRIIPRTLKELNLNNRERVPREAARCSRKMHRTYSLVSVGGELTTHYRQKVTDITPDFGCPLAGNRLLFVSFP